MTNCREARDYLLVHKRRIVELDTHAELMANTRRCTNCKPTPTLSVMMQLSVEVGAVRCGGGFGAELA